MGFSMRDVDEEEERVREERGGGEGKRTKPCCTEGGDEWGSAQTSPFDPASQDDVGASQAQSRSNEAHATTAALQMDSRPICQFCHTFYAILMDSGRPCKFCASVARSINASPASSYYHHGPTLSPANLDRCLFPSQQQRQRHRSRRAERS